MRRIVGIKVVVREMGKDVRFIRGESEEVGGVWGLGVSVILFVLYEVVFKVFSWEFLVENRMVRIEEKLFSLLSLLRFRE